MSDRSFLDWPFFEDKHRALASDLEYWAQNQITEIDQCNIDAACRSLVTALGEGG